MPSPHDQWIERIYEERGVFVQKRLDAPSLRSTEWNPEFEQGMRDRLVLGAFRYGPMSETTMGKKNFDRVGAARERFQRYDRTKNLECLLDIANFCLLEFTAMRNVNPFYSEDDGEHAEVK